MKNYLLINLPYVRKRIGISQSELAKDLNTSQNQISKYEKGNPKPPIDFILEFCKRFGIFPNDLLLKDLSKEPYVIEVDKTVVNEDRLPYGGDGETFMITTMQQVADCVAQHHDRLNSFDNYREKINSVAKDIALDILADKFKHLK